ncbi:disease resistance protein Piks-1-like [Syzygium oleosum]|uniref:disease resistance protein Piks-1-like n=1 Tax=Syzygium oleosum TaxID=219896 RepID=UPI0024BB8CBE|nr:disease resistance protein Piks-1-like [Syzygium oleosum]
MVQQEMIIQMAMHCDKCRSKAMRIATEADEFRVFVCGKYIGNVISVAIRGPHRDQLVVIGEGVDSAKLTRSFRRKFHTIAIVRVSNAGSTRRGTGYYSYDDHEHEHHERVQQYSPPSCYVPYPQCPVYEAVHHAPNPPSISTIM